jgi:hypothetical protein
MLENHILDVDVREVLQSGDIIERSVDQFGMTKFIYLGFTHCRPIHVVVIHWLAGAIFSAVKRPQSAPAVVKRLSYRMHGRRPPQTPPRS